MVCFFSFLLVSKEYLSKENIKNNETLRQFFIYLIDFSKRKLIRYGKDKNSWDGRQFGDINDAVDNGLLK